MGIGLNLPPISANLPPSEKSEKRIERDKVQLALAALADRKIILEKKDGKYMAVVPINGKESVLDKVFVKSEESLVGPPKVLYVDLFGRTVEVNTPVQERIIPKD